jgi:hypothetical protein
LPRFWKIHRHALEHPGPGAILRARYGIELGARGKKRLSSKAEILAFAALGGARG